MELGVFVGRFQPFHLGHLEAVKFALSKVDFLYIAVGSAQKSHEFNNPFTAAERLRMVRGALEEAAIDYKRWMLVPIHDAAAHPLWLSYVHMIVGRVDVVFSNDPLTTRLFKEKGVQVIAVPFLKREIFSATEVRRRMVEGEDWEKLLPKAVAKIVVEIDGVSRLKALKE